MAIKLKWLAGSLALTVVAAACSQSVVEATSAGTTSTAGSGGASTAAATSTAGAGGATSAVATTGVAGTGDAATTAAAGTGGATSAATGTTGTGMLSGCNGVECTANQLCVHPACMIVMGEICIYNPDGGKTCPPGTVPTPQFNNDCIPDSFACGSGCPPKPPFCVDLPPACGGVATCACLASDPCLPSNSGACHDADISAGVLTCSLTP
ncbi:MAG: hypothetical protein ABJE95_28675 [Byssovorax sp.]